MSALIQLSGLRLVCNTEWDADSCNVLLQLPALRSLDISNFYVLPSCLGQLTALEELVRVGSRAAQGGCWQHSACNMMLSPATCKRRAKADGWCFADDQGLYRPE